MKMLTRRLLIAATASFALIGTRSRRTNRSWSPPPPRRRTSGLFGHILPLFKAKTGIDVKVVAQGTGQALDTGRRGDADVVFVHAKAAGGEIRRRRLWREALSGDVQRLHPDRARRAIRPASRAQGHRRGARRDQGQGRRLHLARRQVRHPPGRARPLEGRRHRRPRTRAPGTRRSARAWALRSTPPRLPTPMCSPTAAPGCRSRTAAISNRGRRRRQAAVQPVRRHAGEPGEASARQEGSRPAVHRLAGLGGGPEGDRRLQDQRRAIVLSQRQRSGA